MSKLLNDYEQSFPNQPDMELIVTFKQNNKFIKAPEYLVNYRRPDFEKINELKGKYNGNKRG